MELSPRGMKFPSASGRFAATSLCVLPLVVCETQVVCQAKSVAASKGFAGLQATARGTPFATLCQREAKRENKDALLKG